MALGSTQALTEMSTRNLPGGKEQPACKADNFTPICEPIVQKMWEPRRLTTLWASTAYYWGSFTFFKPYFQGRVSKSTCPELQPETRAFKTLKSLSMENLAGWSWRFSHVQNYQFARTIASFRCHSRYDLEYVASKGPASVYAETDVSLLTSEQFELVLCSLRSQHLHKANNFNKTLEFKLLIN
jgi:hypothetical protein